MVTPRAGVLERVAATVVGLLLIWIAIEMPSWPAGFDLYPSQDVPLVEGTVLTGLAVLLPVRRVLLTLTLFRRPDGGGRLIRPVARRSCGGRRSTPQIDGRKPIHCSPGSAWR